MRMDSFPRYDFEPIGLLGVYLLCHATRRLF